MPVRVRLDELLDQRGLTLTELSESIVFTLANLSIVKTNKARAVRFSTLDAICRELACQPGDLLSWQPGPLDRKDEGVYRLSIWRAQF